MNPHKMLPLDPAIADYLDECKREHEAYLETLSPNVRRIRELLNKSRAKAMEDLWLNGHATLAPSEKLETLIVAEIRKHLSGEGSDLFEPIPDEPVTVLEATL